MLPKSWARRLKTHESVQRAICRCMLLCCAMAPVVVTLACSMVWLSPFYRSAFNRHAELTISDLCGVTAKLRTIHAIAPGRYRIEDLSLSHPETNEVLINANLVLAERSGGSWVLRVDEGDCSAAVLLQLAQTAHGWFMCRVDDRLPPVRLIVNRSSIRTSTAQLSTGLLEAQFTPGQLTSTFQARFTPESISKKAEIESAQTLDFMVRRNRETVNRNTTIQVATSGLDLPVELFHTSFPVLKKLGPEAMFRGTIAVVLTEQEQKLALRQSLFKNCRWESITQDLAYHVSGLGEIWIEEATIANGRLEKADGSLRAEHGGNISRDWVFKAGDIFGVRGREGALDGEGPVHPYSKFLLDFKLDSSGINLWGGYEPPQEGYPPFILADELPLLYEAQTPHYSLGQLAEWLSARPAPIFVEANGVQRANFQSQKHNSEFNPLTAYFASVLPFPEPAPTPLISPLPATPVSVPQVASPQLQLKLNR